MTSVHSGTPIIVARVFNTNFENVTVTHFIYIQTDIFKNKNTNTMVSLSHINTAGILILGTCKTTCW